MPQVGAIETAVVLPELRSREPRRVVAPQELRLVPIEARIQTALRVPVESRRRAVAIGKGDEIRIEAAEQGARILKVEVAEDVAEFLVAGVEMCRRPDLPVPEALEIEGQPAGSEEVVARAGILLRQDGIAGHLVVAHGEIRDTHHEEPAVLHLGSQDAGPFGAGGTVGSHRELPLAARKQPIADEAPFPVDVDLFARHAHTRPGWNRVAMEPHAPATERNA